MRHHQTGGLLGCKSIMWKTTMTLKDSCSIISGQDHAGPATAAKSRQAPRSHLPAWLTRAPGCALSQQRSLKRPVERSHRAAIVPRPRGLGSLSPVRRSQAEPRRPGGIGCGEEFNQKGSEGAPALEAPCSKAACAIICDQEVIRKKNIYMETLSKASESFEFFWGGGTKIDGLPV